MRHLNELSHGTAHRAARLDPTRLPVQFRPVDGNLEQRVVTLDAERMVMARRVGAMAMHITLPVTSYRGVVIRILPGLTESEDLMRVVLAHADRDLDIPLFEATDDSDVIAEWRLWGSALNLPLLIEGVDGHSVAAETRIGGVIADRVKPRRRHSLLANRRTRFAGRRRMGWLRTDATPSATSAANDA